MARNDRERQARILKKRRKEKARHQARRRHTSSEGSQARRVLRHAREYPVQDCLISANWREEGLAQILISRRQPNGRYLFGVFLVDVYCLGLKNTFCNANFVESEFRTSVRERLTRETGFVPCDMDLALTIIYGGIDYAAQFGFKPQEDFDVSQCVLDPKDSFTPRDDVTFGKDGRPFFVSGPDDNVARIVAQLRATEGEGNFDFLSSDSAQMPGMNLEAFWDKYVVCHADDDP